MEVIRLIFLKTPVEVIFFPDIRFQFTGKPHGKLAPIGAPSRNRHYNCMSKSNSESINSGVSSGFILDRRPIICRQSVIYH
jgi:hypothetical protein